jgi:hypothetical protein
VRVALRGQVAQHVGDEHGFFCREGDGDVGHSAAFHGSGG